MRFTRILMVAALALVATVLTAAALADNRGGAVVKIGSSKLGRILVDSHGKTLYLWAHDKSGKSTCYGQCATYWPPLTTAGRPIAQAGARSALLGTTRRADGRMQVTYNRHPLYYFVGDKRAGQTAGEGLTGFGGRWDPVSAAGMAVRKGGASGSGSGYGNQAAPLQATVISPRAGDIAGVGGTFSVDLSLQARTSTANSLLSGYKAAFNDPNAPSFHPGPNAAAPGLVVLLSSTPTIANTPLHGPKTNLAGVFQINDVARLNGLKRTFNSWLVTVPGFFGKDADVTLTVYAVNGTAPAVVTGNEKPVSNVVREDFTIAN
jgi:predicted lipoprotein with Yx(FWY)xxD motif